MSAILEVEQAWPGAAARLGDVLAALGKLTDPAWASALAGVPRHRLVPRYWTQDSDGSWHETDTATAPPELWLPHVYSNSVLVSALRWDGNGTAVVSSSTRPGLMVRMLELLQIREGHRVLEIGTGTGYNAGLLAHRLGSEWVFTLDVEPDLVELARTRLAELGYTPTMRVGDGAEGMPEHAPFDRVIATCAVPAVPWAWVEQLDMGGRLLTDLKIAHGAGSLVALSRVNAERAEGQFDRTCAAFTDLRPAGRPVSPVHRPPGELTDVRVTRVDPRTPWTSSVVWFLAAFEIGPHVSVSYAGNGPGRPPSAVRISTPDGSWAEVMLDPSDPAGGHPVREGGPRALWELVEDAHRLWECHGRPRWERFGLTVTPAGQTVWLDHPAGPRWPLTGPDPGCRSRRVGGSAGAGSRVVRGSS